MAQKIETLVIAINGDASKFKKELAKVKKETTGFQSSLKSAAVVGKASFLAIGAAAATLSTVSTKAFLDFETGLTNVAKTTDLAGEELEEFKKNIIDLSEEIPVSTDKLLEIATAAGQLGIKGAENLTAFTETIAKLGATTNVEGEDAALALARIINLTGEAVSSVGRLGATLVDLGNNFAASESEILEVARDVSKAVAQFEVSSDQIFGLSTAMASLGIQAEAGGTVVGKAFQTISNTIESAAGPSFEKLIELTGLTRQTLVETFEQDSARVFQLFINGLSKAGDEGRSMAGELNALGLSGIRVEKILPALAQRSDILADAMERAGEASAEGSALNEEAAKAFETSASRMEIAQNKINNLFIELGETIAPGIIESIEQITATAEQNTEALRSFVATVGSIFSLAIKGITGFLRLFGGLGEEIRALYDKEYGAVLKRQKELEKDQKWYENLLKRRARAFGMSEEERAAKWAEIRARIRKKQQAAAEEEIAEEKSAEEEKTAVVVEALNQRGILIELLAGEEVKRLKAINARKLEVVKAQEAGASAEMLEIKQAQVTAMEELDRLETENAKLTTQEKLTALEEATLAGNKRFIKIQREHLATLELAELDFAQAQELIEREKRLEIYEVEKEFQQNYGGLKSEALNILSVQEKKSLNDQVAAIKAQKKTIADLELEDHLASLQAKVDRDNEFLKNERKFGETYAKIRAAEHSAIYKGTETAAGELSALVASENENLKNIGKAASIVQIGISSYEGAMKAYTALSGIPYVGPAMGAVAAAALIAFGVEQISNVQRMQTGGIVPGSGKGDTVPAMLEPGEMVVPGSVTKKMMAGQSGNGAGKSFSQLFPEESKLNYSRSVQTPGAKSDRPMTAPPVIVQAPSPGASRVDVEISLKDQLVDFIDAKQREQTDLGTAV